MENRIDQLIQQTEARDSDQRRHSALELGRITPPERLPEVLSRLIALLEDDHLAVREAAEEALVRLGGRPVIDALIPCLAGDSTSVLNYSIAILSRIGTAAIDEILRLLDSKDHDIRKFGCDILGNLQYADSVYELIALLNDPHINVAIAAGEALGKLGNAEAVPYLMRALHHPDTWMRCIAIEALGKIGDPRAVEHFIALTDEEEPIVLYTVLKALGNFQDVRVLPYILKMLRTNPMFAPSAAQALEQLAQGGGTRVYEDVKYAGLGELFVRLLTSEHPEVLFSAIHIVGHLQEAEAIPALGRLLAHPHPKIVQAALAALVQIGEAGLQEIHAVVEQVFTSLDPEVSEQANQPPPAAKLPLIRVLGKIGSPQSIRLLIRALDEHIADEIRVEAAHALGKILRRVPALDIYLESALPPDDILRAAYERLTQAATEPIEALRLTVAETLGDLGTPQACQPLLALVQDPLADVREAASLALAKLRNVPAAEKLAPLHALLQRDALAAPVRAAILKTVARIGGGGECGLVWQALQDAAAEVRVAALEALRGLFCDAATATFPAALTKFCRDPDFQVRVAALRTSVEWAALPETARHGADVAQIMFDVLIAMLEDPHPLVQYEACQQFAQRPAVFDVTPAAHGQIGRILLALMQRPEAIVKIAAVEAFAKLPRSALAALPDALPTLHTLFAETTEPDLQEAIQHTLAVVENL